MVDLIYVPNIIENNGKTFRENNLEKKHSFDIGESVRFTEGKYFSDNYCQSDSVNIQKAVSEGFLIVSSLDRDCDGTHLYTLTLEPVTDLKDGEDLYTYLCRKFNPHYTQNEESFIEASNYASSLIISGISENSIEKFK